MEADEGLDDRKAESGAALASGEPGIGAALEDLGAEFLAHRGALVLDDEQHALAAG